MTKKILVVTGTRAEYGLLRSTMDAIRSHQELELKVLVTGMHMLPAYGDTKEEIARDGYTIDRTVPIKPQSDQLQALSQEIEGIRAYCLADRPDCVVVLGDRDEPFAAAIVAAHMNIPIAHIHGGDVSGPGVDEGIRHSITKFAHLHFPGTHRSAERIKAMAEEPSRIFEVGSVVVDILQDETLLDRATLAQTLGIDAAAPWLTVLQHPTAFDYAPLPDQINATLHALASFPDHEKIVLYPNSDAGTEIFIAAIEQLGTGFTKAKSLPRIQFMSLVKESDALVGNSSAGIIETAYLGTPTVNIGNRQRGREHGESVIDVPYETGAIADGVKKAIDMKKQNAGKPFASPYGAPGAGKKIAALLSEQLKNPELLNKRFAA